MKKLLLNTFIACGFSIGAFAQCITPAAPTFCPGGIVALNANPGGAGSTFTNAANIDMPAGQPGTTSGNFGPYPSNIVVSGLATSGMLVSSVQLNGMSHTFPGDIDLALVSPTGQVVVLMSDAGGTNDYVNNNFVIRDGAAAFGTGANPSGTYSPTNLTGADVFPAPGPGTQTTNTSQLASFTGNMNGTWQLYGVDDAGGDAGAITGGWSITFAPVVNVTWSGGAGTIYSNSAATTPYVAGTPALTVWVKPTATTTYTANFSSGPCAGNQNVTVTLNPPSACYCTPTSISCTASDVITNVTFAGINNSSACSANGYGDYTSTVAAGNAIAGTTLPIAVTVGPGGTEYVGVWIDYDQSGTFDVSEFKAIGSANGATINNTITIPSSALTGTTRMRVRVQYNTAVTATMSCSQTSTLGEVEDYKINITPCVPLTVTAAPTAQTVVCGGNATFTATITGSAPTYQWQIQSAPGVFTDLTNVAPYSGVTTNTLTITGVTTAMNGNNYRLLYSGGCTSTNFTAPVSLTVTPIAATFTQSPAALCAGGSTAQTITVTGGGTGVFSPVTGLYTDAAHTIPYAGTPVATVYAFPTSTSTYSYVRTNGSCVSNAATITVTVNAALAGPAVIPATTAICANATGTITATGIVGDALTYQWQVNSVAAPATFTNLSNAAPYSGVTTPTLTITNPSGALSGLKYQLVVTSATCGTSITSNATTLTVNSIPVVTVSASPNTLLSPATQVVLTAAVSSATAPISYQWYLNTVLIPGATGATYTVNPNQPGDYTVSVVDANGCGAATSTPLTLTIVPNPSTILFISPSPNNGVFNVRYFNSKATPTSTEQALLNIFDNKGSRVFTQRYTLTGPYTQMRVDLGTHGGGIYRVELSDAQGNRIQTGSVMVF